MRVLSSATSPIAVDVLVVGIKFREKDQWQHHKVRSGKAHSQTQTSSQDSSWDSYYGTQWHRHLSQATSTVLGWEPEVDLRDTERCAHMQHRTSTRVGGRGHVTWSGLRSSTSPFEFSCALASVSGEQSMIGVRASLFPIITALVDLDNGRAAQGGAESRRQRPRKGVFQT